MNKHSKAGRALAGRREFITTSFSLTSGIAIANGWATVARAQTSAPQLGLEEALKRLAEKDYLLMIRHAQTVPGVGDPPEFKLNQCNTQRNLSEEGRAYSVRLGQALKSLKIRQVHHSEWCRTRDTAELAFSHLGKDLIKPFNALNSFFGRNISEPMQTQALRKAALSMSKKPGPGHLVWVTHQVNISALVGGFAAMGEVIAIDPSRVTLAFQFQI